MPWCSSRCGYCDFNTYVPGAIAGASPTTFVPDALAELTLAREVVGGRAVDTVFFGGGTPTLVPANQLVAVLHAIDSQFGLAPGAEITTEANPETLNANYLAELRAGGFNRISLGMQSAVGHVLAALDRIHTPGRAVEAAREAFDAGFEEVSLDLIYGTPGESDDDWRRSLDAVLEVGPSHVSAYSLIVEAGTRMARLVASGKLEELDDDVMARRYEMADTALLDAGLEWYEVSNWARGGIDGSACRHNLGYWRGDDWWGIGPGAHSHLGDVRWWNVKHPARYSVALANGDSPEAARETLLPKEQWLEHVMLGIRTSDGLSVDELGGLTPARQAQLVADGLVESAALAAGRIVLTLRGRLLADLLVRDLTEASPTPSR